MFRVLSATPRKGVGALPPISTQRMMDRRSRVFAVPGFVYFAGSDGGPVKIGASSQPLKRIRDIQWGSPVDVAVIALIETADKWGEESLLHSRFSNSRLRGEWFARTPELELLMRENHA